MNRHSEGKWKINVEDDNNIFIESFFENKKKTIALVSRWDTGEEAKANAKLISAAPDLLAACKLAMSVFDSKKILDDHGILLTTINLLRVNFEDAMSKAKGFN